MHFSSPSRLLKTAFSKPPSTPPFTDTFEYCSLWWDSLSSNFHHLVGVRAVLEREGADVEDINNTLTAQPCVPWDPTAPSTPPHPVEGPPQAPRTLWVLPRQAQGMLLSFAYVLGLPCKIALCSAVELTPASLTHLWVSGTFASGGVQDLGE